MQKLKKSDFNEKYRFRKSRNDLVSCFSCDNMLDEYAYDKETFCNHEERFRKIKLIDYLGPDWKNWNNSKSHVCDIFKSKSLPEEIKIPYISEEHAIILNNIIHTDPQCPYILEELRTKPEKSEDLPEERDISLWKYADPYSMCEMPCCESEMPSYLKYWRIDYYRRENGLKPDGTEYVREKEVVPHEIKILETELGIERIFNLSKFKSEKYGDSHDMMWVAKKHLREKCNRLGTISLAGAVNPIMLDCAYIEPPRKNSNGEIEFWVMDGRIFDWRNHTHRPLRDNLENIPEGALFCIDTKFVLPWNIGNHPYLGLKGFDIFGNIKSSKEEGRIGPEYFIDVRAISYSDVGNSWMSGVFGRGFNIEARSSQ